LYYPDAYRWSEKDAHGLSRKDKLLKRQHIIDTIRAYFRDNQFLEAEIPLLVAGTTPDTFIQSFELRDNYLTTSTEYHIKRMIAGGFEKVFTLTKNFRRYEFDRYHNPEFTMLEWARTGVSLGAIENDAKNFVFAAFKALFPDADCLAYQNARIPLQPDRWQEMTFQDVFYRYYGIEIPEDYNIGDTVNLAKKAGLPVDDAFAQDADFLLSDLLDRAITKLGFDAPVLIKKWPAAMTASAECASINAKWSDRTEVIIAGIEVADGFPFLRDYAMQNYFFEQSNDRRKKKNLPPVIYDQSYLSMLKNGLPQGAGMALGIDRLCMLLTDSTDIKDVLCFAWDEL
jgi:lysyl-tRNA synthetase class 2